jgi:hypothetical protein
MKFPDSYQQSISTESCNNLNVEAKRCSKCHKVKLVTEFHSKGNGRFNSRCKSCVSKDKSKKYRTKQLSKKGNNARRTQLIEINQITETISGAEVSLEMVRELLSNSLAEVSGANYGKSTAAYY